MRVAALYDVARQPAGANGGLAEMEALGVDAIVVWRRRRLRPNAG
jgi:hypothetical protein